MNKRWCQNCNVYLYEGLSPPASHSRHSRIDKNITNTFCNICNTILYDGLAPSIGHQRHVIADAKKRNESIQQQMIAQEVESHGKFYNKGTYVPIKVAPNTMMVAHEKNVRKMVEAKNK